MNNNKVEVIEPEPEPMHVNEAIHRMRTNLRHARVLSSFDSADALADHLGNQYGVDVSRSSINRYQQDNGPKPSIEYIIGLHWHTGIPVDVLLGLNVWGNDKGQYPPDNPEGIEILNMYNSLTPELKEIAESQLYALVLHSEKEPEETTG